MKKYIQFLIGLAVSSALVFGILLFDRIIKPNVGWNGSPFASALTCQSLDTCDFHQPDAGWNS